MATTMLFHCVFNKDSSITHFMNTGIDDVAEYLPNLYVVLLCQRERGNVKNIVGAMIVKTLLKHDEKAFSEALYNLCMAKKELTHFMASKKTSFLPAKVGFEGSPLLTEDECLQLVMSQYLSHSQTLMM